MFKMHTTCRYGLVVKQFQVIFYQPGVFVKMMAGNYMGDFVCVSYCFDKSNRAVWKPRRPNIEEIPAHLLAGAIPPEKKNKQPNIFEKSIAGLWRRPGVMAPPRGYGAGLAFLQH